MAHQLSQDVGPPLSRTLPYPYGAPAQTMPQPEYVQSVRPPYPGMQQTPYSMPMARMPLPSSSSNDAASMMYGASRHGSKHKEVKRRTKTGCLTCRKRRIKCGEERPQCRNCVKSKRDCAGYDHLQTHPSPSIQPAPTSTPATSHPPRSSYTVEPPTSPATSSHYNSVTTGSPRDQQDYVYHSRSADAQLPNINQAYGGSSYPPQRYP